MTRTRMNILNGNDIREQVDYFIDYERLIVVLDPKRKEYDELSKLKGEWIDVDIRQ